MADNSHPASPPVIKFTGHLVIVLISGLSLTLTAEPIKSNHSSVSRQPELSIRTRLAQVEQANSGRAASYRLRLNWQSQILSHLDGKIEFDHIDSYWDEHHSDGVRFNNMPVIPDAPSTHINEAWLGGHWQGSNVKIGKQRFEFNNQRHIGSNGFWQDEQTFEAANFSHLLGMSTTLELSYLTKVYRISGPNADQQLHPSDSNYTQFNGLRPAKLRGEHKLNTIVGALKTSYFDVHKMGVYAIDNDNKTAPELSYRSYGATYHWKQAFGALKASIEADLSLQDRQNTKHIPYSRLRGSLRIQHWHLALEQEQLGSRDNTPYITPMASLHDFQGFADQFLVTPAQGITDDQLSAQYSYANFKLQMTGHHFTASSHSEFLGKEFDLDLKLPKVRQLETHIRYAYFDAPASQQDAQRLFFTINISL